jgi:hypothetical protein
MCEMLYAASALTSSRTISGLRRSVWQVEGEREVKEGERLGTRKDLLSLSSCSSRGSSSMLYSSVAPHAYSEEPLGCPARGGSGIGGVDLPVSRGRPHPFTQSSCCPTFGESVSLADARDQVHSSPPLPRRAVCPNSSLYAPLRYASCPGKAQPG